MSNKIENNAGTTPETGQDTTLAYLVDGAERHAANILEIRHRLERVLSRLTGPSGDPTPEDEGGDEKATGSLLERLDNANTRTSSEISQLEDKISRLEALA